jgi:formylglycine-generating enzyme required for sulfatase activity
MSSPIHRHLMAAATVMALLAGCGARPSNESSPPPTTSAPASAAVASTLPAAKPHMIRIAGGKFPMGDKEQADAPVHEVVVSSFQIDARLVTQEHYEKVMGSNPSRWKGGSNPVEQVRWSDAARFCNRRSELEGLLPCYDTNNWQCNFKSSGYRLPTEAEWEYACRAGTITAFFFGDSPAKLGEHAWFDKNAAGHPRPVAQKKPNPWGLYDICGNVWEWCNDFYKVDYYQE